MSWDRKVMSPPASPPERRLREMSMGLVKSLGFIGFMVLGLGTLHIGEKRLGLPEDYWFASNWSVDTAALFGFSFLAAFVGMTAGRSLGASISIKSRRCRHVIDTLWHFAANGFIIWSFLVNIAFARKAGGAGIERLVRSIGSTRFTVYEVGIGTVGCLLIGSLLLALGFWKDGERPRLVAGTLATLPISLGMTYLMLAAVHFASKAWILIGILLPPILIPISAYTLARDEAVLARSIPEGGR